MAGLITISVVPDFSRIRLLLRSQGEREKSPGYPLTSTIRQFRWKRTFYSLRLYLFFVFAREGTSQKYIPLTDVAWPVGYDYSCHDFYGGVAFIWQASALLFCHIAARPVLADFNRLSCSIFMGDHRLCCLGCALLRLWLVTEVVSWCAWAVFYHRGTTSVIIQVVSYKATKSAYS